MEEGSPLEWHLRMANAGVEPLTSGQSEAVAERIETATESDTLTGMAVTSLLFKSCEGII